MQLPRFGERGDDTANGPGEELQTPRGSLGLAGNAQGDGDDGRPAGAQRALEQGVPGVAGGEEATP